MPAAYEEYQLALKGGGEKPTKKEMENFDRSYRHWKYRYDNESASGEKYADYLANIKGIDLMNDRDLSFYDSLLVAFNLDDARHTAVLKMTFDREYLITVCFSGVQNTRLYCEAGAEYISNFHCYRDRFPPHPLIFSLGVLEVVCSEIEIASVEDIRNNR